MEPQDTPIDQPESCLGVDTVLAFVEGELDASARSNASRHLLSCPICSDLVAGAADGEPGRSLPTDPSARKAPLSKGTVFGRYVILDLVGHGGTSAVYGAYDQTLDRRVALKVLHEGYGSPGFAMAGQDRLLREAKAIARLSHPNVVMVYDAGEIEGRVFLAMELVEGQNLAAWLTAKRRRWREIRSAFESAARGLAAAHRAGIVHRDFKPQNVMVGVDGVVRVTDFGLARDGRSREALEGRALPAVDPSAAALTPRTLALTRSGGLIGTPLYMAPELFRGEPADARADQFAFCVALHEAIFGQRPFPSDSLATLREAAEAGRIRNPPRGRRVPFGVRRLIRRGLEPDRANRFPSMDALLVSLGRPKVYWRRLFQVTTLLVCVLGGGLLFRASKRDRAMCRGGAERIAQVWPPASASPTSRRAAIGGAFAASGRAYAAIAWDQSAKALDRYAGEWTEMYRDACEATRVRGEQSEALLDLRVACLHRMLTSVRALTDVFASADATTVDHAVEAVYALPPIGACGDVRSLLAAVPPPDPKVRAQVDELRESLAVAKELGDTGRPDESQARCRSVAEAASAIGYVPLGAEAHLEAARQAIIYGRDEAETEARQALLAAESVGQDEVVATAAEILLAAFVDKGEREQAWFFSDMAEAALRRIGEHQRLWVWLLDDRAELLGTEGNYAGALETAQRAATLAENSLGKDHLDFGVATNSVAIAFRDLGRAEEALSAIDRALAIFRPLYGPQNPFLALALSNRGEILSALHRWSEALADSRQALDLWTAGLGPDHPHLAFALTGMGEALSAQGRHREAVPLLERAVVLRTTHRAPLGRLADSQIALAKALWDANGDRDRATRLARDAQAGFAVLPSLSSRARIVRDWLQTHAAGAQPRDKSLSLTR